MSTKSFLDPSSLKRPIKSKSSDDFEEDGIDVEEKGKQDEIFVETNKNGIASQDNERNDLVKISIDFDEDEDEANENKIEDENIDREQSIKNLRSILKRNIMVERAIR